MKTFKATGIFIVRIIVGVLLLTGTALAQLDNSSWWIIYDSNSHPSATYPTAQDYIWSTIVTVPTIRIQQICDQNGQHCKAVSSGWGAASNVLTTPDGQTNVVSVNSSSNVGVGTTNPQSKFAVNGTITAKEVKVTQTGWSDYVFAEDYRLLPLDELEAYVGTEKHLPGIPAAKEVEEKGLAVADMLTKQMQKIEELTLYLIQLKNENRELKERITALEEEK
jgi:hypothetical protein